MRPLYRPAWARKGGAHGMGSAAPQTDHDTRASRGSRRTHSSGGRRRTRRHRIWLRWHSWCAGRARRCGSIPGAAGGVDASGLERCGYLQTGRGKSFARAGRRGAGESSTAGRLEAALIARKRRKYSCAVTLNAQRTRDISMGGIHEVVIRASVRWSARPSSGDPWMRNSRSWAMPRPALVMPIWDMENASLHLRGIYTTHRKHLFARYWHYDIN